MFWCLAPWQLLCMDHNHNIVEKDIQSLVHQEENNAFHGCDLDFFSAINDIVFFQFHASQFLVCFDGGIFESPILGESDRCNGRAPPRL